MVPGGGKAKGAQFERRICVQLSRWLTKGEREDCFWRSAMSGGRATVRFKKGKSTHAATGDLTATSQEAHAFLSKFVVECKHVADLNLRAALIDGAGPLRDYWLQVSTDAIRSGKMPLLIACQNRFPPLVFMWASQCSTYFGAISQIECGRFFKFEGYRVSMFKLNELLGFPYVAKRFE